MTEVAVGRLKGHLPAGVTSFVGRRQDAGEVQRLLSLSRLVTLTGIGGVGKTRLALRVAEGRRRAFTGGVWWVELADVADPDLLALTIMQALGAEQQAAATADELIRHVGDRQLLLVLDNCEHLVEACAELVSTLLAAAPRVHVLATSREPLGVTGEHVFRVLPLSVPYGEGASDPVEDEAVKLFKERASAAAPGFAVTEANRQVVVTLCRKLDGLPLAIELAASRTRVFTVDQILQRWDEQYGLMTGAARWALPRHRTLRAAMDWSFRLCSEAEQVLLARLSVFSGSFDLQAAEAICGGSALEVLGALGGLVEKSLVVHEGKTGRYRLLETVRWYGREHLAERGEELDLARRHRDYYLSLAEAYAAGWFGPGQKRLFTQIQGEQVNLRAALTFCLDTPGEERAGLRMTRLLWSYWWFRPWAEGQYWLERALAKDTGPSPDRSMALAVAGVMAVVLGDKQRGLRLVDQARQIARDLGDRESIAHTTSWCGLARVVHGEIDLGTRLLQEGLELERALPGTDPVLSLARHGLGGAFEHAGQFEQSAAVFEALQDDLEAAGEHLVRSITLTGLAITELRRGQTSKAATWARAAITVHRDYGGTRDLARAIEILAWIAVEDADHARAARLFGITGQLWQRLGQDRTASYARWRAQFKQQARQALGDQAFETKMREGAELDFDEAIGYALGTAPTPGHPGRKGPAPQELTRRELEVAGLVAEGLSNKEIADRLVISQRTAENHVGHVLIKLGFTSRTQIAAWVAGNRA